LVRIVPFFHLICLFYFSCMALTDTFWCKRGGATIMSPKMEECVIPFYLLVSRSGSGEMARIGKAKGPRLIRWLWLILLCMKE
jgi:hypothetical protein